MAQSVKLKDGSYIDAGAVYDTTQKSTVEALFGNLYVTKDCSSEIASMHKSIVELNLLGAGKVRFLAIYCKPNGTLSTNTWVNQFVTFNKGPIAVACATIAPGSENDVAKGASAFLYKSQIAICLGGQAYPEDSNKYFRLSAIYLVS